MKRNESVLSLTRIFLHNWHRFNHHLIDVEDSLYLAGHNGSGKSSVLDAMQLVLIADQTRIRYNSSAQERSARTLDSYVRGKIGENRFLRPGKTIAYVALEFSSTTRKLTCGVCIEAAESQSPERTFFILPEALDPEILLPERRPLSRRELRQALRNRRGAHTYDQVGEYQDELLNRLGGLNQRFFDMFLRALTFQPIRDINAFVEQWLLDEAPLNVDALQKVVERLTQLRITVRDVQEKINALQAIVKQQADVGTWRDRHAEYLLLAALLRQEEAHRNVAALSQEHAELIEAITKADEACATAEAARRGAVEAQLEAEVQLRQSDVIRRREELQKLIAQHTREADQIRAVYQVLLNDLRRETQMLVPLHHESALPSLAPLHATITALTLDAPPPKELATQLNQAVAELDAELEPTQRAKFTLEQQISHFEERRAEILNELVRLQQGQKALRNQHTERLCDLLTPIVGERPPLLCDLLEIPDPRWQNAVEAILGGRRFNIIVPPQVFGKALHVLDRARQADQIYDVGLVDLEKARSDGRRAQPGSLAEKIHTRSDVLRPYIDTVLGDIICCDTIDQLRRYRRAVTPEVVLYSEFSVRALHPRTYTPWYIGSRAKRSQIEAYERELQTLNEQLASMKPQVSELQVRITLLQQGRALTLLQGRLDAPLDERPLRADIAAMQAELQTLDLSGVAALEQEVKRLQAIAEQEQKRERRALEERARLKERLPRLEQDLRRAQAEYHERQQQAHAQRTHTSQAIVEAAEAKLADRLAQPDLAEVLRNTETSARNFDTRAANELQRLIEMASTYNTRHQFAALPSNIDEPRYKIELERLQATELPRYAKDIDQAQAEAEEELREHVLHRLREHILQARQKLEWINDALKNLTFHGDSYRFTSQPAEEVRDYYNLINDSQLIGSGSLFESDFYQRHRNNFEEFYERLTRTPQSEIERREQERLLDYRRYLSYDIDVISQNGQRSRLSRIMGQTSGGETQTPFYLTIAASFVQMYRVGERNSRPTIRLVLFDEAFSKMDQDRIGATLDLFQHFGLQIVTATPLERCEYLVPKMCTNLVLTGIGDTVHIEPYRNYAARLNATSEAS